jgi:type II secretory pathway pseudopilin PulG
MPACPLTGAHAVNPGLYGGQQRPQNKQGRRPRRWLVPGGVCANVGVTQRHANAQVAVCCAVPHSAIEVVLQHAKQLCRKRSTIRWNMDAHGDGELLVRNPLNAATSGDEASVARSEHAANDAAGGVGRQVTHLLDAAHGDGAAHPAAAQGGEQQCVGATDGADGEQPLPLEERTVDDVLRDLLLPKWQQQLLLPPSDTGNATGATTPNKVVAPQPHVAIGASVASFAIALCNAGAILLCMAGAAVYVYLVGEGATRLRTLDQELEDALRNQTLTLTEQFSSEVATRGQYGDSFGVVTAFFSILAAAGAIVTMRLQRKSLTEQRQQLQEQRQAQQQQLLEQRRAQQRELREARVSLLLTIFTDSMRLAEEADSKPANLLSPEAACELLEAINCVAEEAEQPIDIQARIRQEADERYSSLVFEQLPRAKRLGSRSVDVAGLVMTALGHAVTARREGGRAHSARQHSAEAQQHAEARMQAIDRFRAATATDKYVNAIAYLTTIAAATIPPPDGGWTMGSLLQLHSDDAALSCRTALSRRTEYIKDYVTRLPAVTKYRLPFRTLVTALDLLQRASDNEDMMARGLAAAFLLQLSPQQLQALFYMSLTSSLLPREAAVVLARAQAFSDLHVGSLLEQSDAVVFSRVVERSLRDAFAEGQ